MTKDEFYKKFLHFYPFIYCLNNDYYFISDNICRKCTENEKTLFNDFMTELNYLLQMRADKRCQTKNLKSYIDKIDACNHITNGQLVDQTYELKKFILNLSESELENLYNQYNNRNIALNLYEGLFHRVYKND